MKPRDRKPVALLVDDDPEHNKIISVVLKKLGIHAVATSSAKEFLLKLKELRPDICLVDLNVDDLGIGFTILRAVRNVLGPKLPLLVISGRTERQAIAHAIEVGANDFITKPVDRDILASKLTRYIKTEELLSAESNLFPVPEGGAPATLEVDFDLREVDEFGIRIVSKHLLNKGSVYYIDSPLLHEITGTGQAQLYTITSTSLDEDCVSYSAFAEFDVTNQEVLSAVRRWLTQRS